MARYRGTAVCNNHRPGVTDSDSLVVGIETFCAAHTLGITRPVQRTGVGSLAGSNASISTEGRYDAIACRESTWGEVFRAWRAGS